MEALNLGEILWEYWEILGKYPILDVKSVGSKGLKWVICMSICISFHLVLAHFQKTQRVTEK